MRVSALGSKVSFHPTLYMAHSDSELLDIMFSPIVKPDLRALEYPFYFISCDDHDNGYNPQHFSRGLATEEPFDVGNFPANITKYYYIRKRSKNKWETICAINTPSGRAYAHYKASCDNTGFDYNGRMKLVVSKSKENLFSAEFSDHRRRKIAKRKQALRTQK
jgi:hypothetical protein